jgi:hypothetical protein
MPLNPRTIALTVSILAFFTTSIVSAFCRNCPFTCCKRAVIAMLAAYVFTTIVVKVINVVLVDAIISKQVNRTLNRLKGKGNRHGGAS